MNSDWSERRAAERRVEEGEYRAQRAEREWREHFDQCGDRDPCPHAG